jgi:hypothetical protein
MLAWDLLGFLAPRINLSITQDEKFLGCGCKQSLCQVVWHDDCILARLMPDDRFGVVSEADFPVQLCCTDGWLRLGRVGSRPKDGTGRTINHGNIAHLLW